MNKFRIFAYAAVALIATSLQSCLDDNDNNSSLLNPTALVTVRPAQGGSFTLQLNDSTVLYPANVKTSPYGDKEVRALVNYKDAGIADGKQTVYVNWMDSIMTKLPVATVGAADSARYGNDAIEIVKDWVTVAEDGYLTLRVRTLWSNTSSKHVINLVSGVNANNPYELELRHDAKGDTNGNMADALIAFNLNGLPKTDDGKVKLKIRWKSFSGQKSAEFDLRLRSVK